MMNGKHKPDAVERIKGILAVPMTAGNIRNLLVDTRILLERKGKAKQYKTLKFYCDWVLHSVLDGKFASQLLADVDSVLDKWWNSQIPPQNFKDTIGYHIGFYGFEEELEAFLKSLGINIARPGFMVNWRTFEQLYCENLVS